jgi:hypothetical protein
MVTRARSTLSSSSLRPGELNGYHGWAYDDLVAAREAQFGREAAWYYIDWETIDVSVPEASGKSVKSLSADHSTA